MWTDSPSGTQTQWFQARQDGVCMRNVCGSRFRPTSTQICTHLTDCRNFAVGLPNFRASSMMCHALGRWETSADKQEPGTITHNNRREPYKPCKGINNDYNHQGNEDRQGGTENEKLKNPDERSVSPVSLQKGGLPPPSNDNSRGMDSSCRMALRFLSADAYEISVLWFRGSCRYDREKTDDVEGDCIWMMMA